VTRLLRSLVSDEFRLQRAVSTLEARARNRPRARWAYCVPVALPLLLACAPQTVETKSPIAPATTAAARERETSLALTSFLGDRLKHELKLLDLNGDAWPPGYTADASLLSLLRSDRAGREKVSCTVLLTLLDSTHSPVATVRGNASAEGARGHPTLARDAVGGAAHAAVSQLPLVLERVQKK
jgi:hypothetical protein